MAESEGTMKGKARRNADPLERQTELALRPGSFIGDRGCFSFVRALDKALASIGALTKTEPARAAALCETFLAGCYEKVEELDDSSGCIGQFVSDLIGAWINIEKDFAQALDKPGLAEFERRIRVRFEAAARPEPGTPPGSHDHPHRRCSEVPRTPYNARTNMAAYVARAEQAGITARDCSVLGGLLARRRPHEALAWVERGLALEWKTPGFSTVGCELARLKRQLLTKLDGGDEAVRAAWSEFQSEADKYPDEGLMKLVPKAERAAWHEKAMNAAQSGELRSVLALFLEINETERLAAAVDTAAGEDLKRIRRIVRASKSTHSDAARSNFDRARRCYERAGLTPEWEETVRRVFPGHSRKAGFMPGFEALASRGKEPSFLDRAKTRWCVRHRGGGL